MKDVRRAGAYGRQNEKKALPQKCLFSCALARPERFERPTPWFVAKYSIQLSYGRAANNKKTNPAAGFSVLTWRARDDSNVRPLPSEGSTLSS